MELAGNISASELSESIIIVQTGAGLEKRGERRALGVDSSLIFFLL